MKKLFLSSQFSQVADKLLGEFGDSLGNKKVGFIPTAAEIYDDPWWMRQDREKLVELGFSVLDIPVSKLSKEEIKQQLSDVDIIFVAGGNTFYLLQELRESGADAMLADFIDQGKLYIGSSAGSVIVGSSLEPVKTLDDVGDAPKLKNYDGLQIVDFVVLPHIGHPKFDPIYRQGVIAKYQDVFKLKPITDDQAVVVRGGEALVV